MRVLIDVSHPALAHVFGHVIPAFHAKGHETLVVARDKDVTLALLEAYGIAHQVLAPAGRTQRGRLRELMVREVRMLALARKFRPHLITGTSVHAARAGFLLRCRSAVLNDDDAAAVPLFRWLAYPLAIGHRHARPPGPRALGAPPPPLPLVPRAFLPAPQPLPPRPRDPARARARGRAARTPSCG